MSREFYFKVIDKQGKYHQGNLLSDNIEDAAHRLKEQGYYILKLKKLTNFNMKVPIILNRVKIKDLASLNSQLAVLLNSGITLLNALEIIEGQLDKPYLQKVLTQIRKKVQEGRSLSDSLREFPRVFNKMMIKVVEAGELGGVLDELTEELAEHFEREHEIIEKVKGAMLYPVLVLVVSLAAVIFITLFVLPTFAMLLGEMTSQLPLPTQILLTISNLIINYWFILLLFIVFLIMSICLFCMSPKGKRILDLTLLKIPLHGGIYNKILVARFSRTFGTLLGAGVPILQALEVSAEATDNYIFINHIHKCLDLMQDGESMAKNLSASWLFPNTMIQIVKVGEETGKLDKLLIQLGTHLQKEVDKKLDKLSTLIEPILIIIVGIIVGFLVISMVLPIFNIISSF